MIECRAQELSNRNLLPRRCSLLFCPDRNSINILYNSNKTPFTFNTIHV